MLKNKKIKNKFNRPIKLYHTQTNKSIKSY